MRKGYAEYKARKGLIKVNVVISDNTISSITISGDFMLHPENVIWELEDEIRGIEADPREIEKILRKKLCKIGLIGISVDDFIYVITEAVERARDCESLIV